MKTIWKSRKIYQAIGGAYGHICQSASGGYHLRANGLNAECDQSWAQQRHAEEIATRTHRIGRPRIGDARLEVLAVPRAIRDALQARAMSTGLSVPDVRRAAYTHYLEATAI